MSIESLFGLASSMVLPAWAALLFAPSRWRVAPRLVCAIMLALAAIYTGLILAFWAQASGDFKSLDGIARLFDHRGLLLAGWVHYLAFDLLIGWWERTEASRIGLPRLLLAPCLLLTFLFGPIGWLLFMALRLYHLGTQAPSVTPA